jgi:hypothetical protein
MKKKPYILPKSKAIDVADPIANFHRDEDEKYLWDLIEESNKEDKPCSHPECRSHVTHPCENCGRQWGK